MKFAQVVENANSYHRQKKTASKILKLYEVLRFISVVLVWYVFEKGDDPVEVGQNILRYLIQHCNKKRNSKNGSSINSFMVRINFFFCCSHEKAISEGLTGHQRK
jgi:hypothetical protein